MHRFFVESDLLSPDSFTLNKDDTYHAARVLRLHKGDRAEVISNGRRYLSVIDECSSASVVLHPLHELPSTETGISLTLFQGMPKGDKMDLIVQKAVELGVSGIVPVLFSRSVARPDKQDADRKIARWRKIAVEACKQSGRCCVPVLSPVIPFDALPEHLDMCEQVAVPWEECAENGPKSFFLRHQQLRSLGIVIGPEGGISSEEMEVLTAAGCEAITLGKRILRTETAAIAALSVFSGFYGEME